ncbi:cyclic AMP-responsive element-binding protein 5 isoform X1 [Stegostoma tigrinum]|uniref:cyclic AMP-responsive element-binding protein 5 isoform X1 n=1 Tax=Stegostoma tigrinum TaxID=3053191 RepID=UPI00202AF1C9|nr:cyclic AMP-responsive element-binding protein 5 isoform X1 [Stegostoma tigrinum]XP_059510230.1 cyclic AMP-responsive element-binding protein 5 isoform X1 [Stegostoma tigrinum]
MNLEQDRPFVCNAPGCAQRFPTEDHLMIHRHKHEMTLKFPAIKTDNILSDQTPTPTRFLKNCEEVGLFNELACSLEQEFRKAQEEEDNKRVSVGLNISNLSEVQGKETSITDSSTQASALSRTVSATRSDKNLSVHGSVQGPMSGSASHLLATTRMPNHDSGVVIQQAMPSPTSSSVITQAPSTNRQIGPVPGSLSSLLHLHNRQRQPMPGSMPGNLSNSAMPVSSSVLMPMDRQLSMSSNIMGMPGPSLNNQCTPPQVQQMHSEAKMRLKAALSQQPTALSNGNMNMMGQVMEMMTSRQEQAPHHHMHSHQPQPPPHHPFTHQHHPHHHQQNHPHSHPHLHTHPPQHQTPPLQPLTTGTQNQVSPGAQQMQSPQSGHPTPTSGGRRRRVVDEDPDERRRKFLERNRAAATRCRQKRKVWVLSLEKKAEELTQTNMQLQNEVSLLKNEVTQLKQLLLTHKDCPITTMQEETQSYLSPENSQPGSPIPACSQQQVIQHNSISTSTAVNEVVGSSTLTQLTNQRTDLNPIL